MGWTPHPASVTSIQPDPYQGVVTNSPVVIGPNSRGVTSTEQRVPFTITPSAASTTAKQTETISGDLGAALGSVGQAAGLDAGSLQQLIMENTDKNNAWSAAQAQKQMDFQERMQGIAQEFNASEAAKNRDWQLMLSNSAHQREVADLKAAGLNPILSASGGNGAAMGSGSAASVGMQSGAQGNPDQSGNAALVSLYSALLSAQTQMANANLSARTNLQMAQMQQEASMYAAALGAEASKYAAGTNYAAQTYAADKNFENNEEQRKWNAAHPSNMYQAGASILGSTNTPTGKGLLSGNSGIHFIDDAVNYVKGRRR